MLALAAVVAGGLLAAVAATAESEVGAWAAAYLVLVMGMAQAVLVVGRVAWAPSGEHGTLVPLLVGWNVGSLAVILGTAAESFVTVLAGSVLLVAVLVECGLRVRSDRHRGLLAGYRVVVAALLVSVVIGCVLAR